MSPVHFAAAVQTYCQALDGSVTSWGRTRAHNSAVGGVPGSAHRFWLAVDIVYDVKAASAERIETAKRLGLRCIIEADHDHLQPADWIAG